MRRPAILSVKIAAAVATAAVVLSGCSTVVSGKPSAGIAANANIPVVGDSHGQLDTTVKNAMSDVLAFWKVNFPTVAGGKALPPLKGGFYSIDGAQVVQSGKVSGPAAREGCVAEEASFIIDNAAYCRLDDSIVWDRNPNHLVGVLANKYGALMVALVFAHEFGHAVQQRLGTFDENVPVIDTESQADCAAGSFLADVVAGRAAHFRTTGAQLDEALNGYLQVRDTTPNSSADISHGNGFDRLSAIDDGLLHGSAFCYSTDYFNRKFTERPFVRDSDYQTGGNETLAQVLNPNDTTKDQTAGGLQPDLNRFWTAAAKSAGKTWQDVKIAQAPHPKCGASAASEFGYCPDDNTVYYSDQFASEAYNSLTERRIDPNTKNVSLVDNQPADFALGTLFAVGWGMAVRHQLFSRPIDGKDALLAAACYTGAYSKDVNLPQGDAQHPFILSPPDMDEATSAMLNLVGLDKAFGARGTTGLQRIQSFVKGYNGGLSVC
ncbi:MAG: putative metalloprotease [Pseudonocardiales bacterium]|nr:putative metalloprotease [Pseudonocardiales bacterium]